MQGLLATSGEGIGEGRGRARVSAQREHREAFGGAARGGGPKIIKRLTSKPHGARNVARVAKLNDVSTWMKPASAARRLGVTRFRLNQLAAAGELVAKRDFYGALRFDPQPVEALRQRVDAGTAQVQRISRVGRMHGDGKAHAKAFRMFSEGAEPRVVVIETELTTTVVLDLRRQYAEMGRDFVLAAPDLAELRELLDWQGEATPRAFFHALRAKMRKQFERGQAVAAETDKHTTEGTSSGNIDAGTESKNRRAHEKGGAALRGDGQDDEAIKPRVRGT